MGYECLGNDQYKVTMIIFRDCADNGAIFDDPASIALYIGDALVTSFSANLTAFENIELASYENCDLDPSLICVEKGTYEFEITLPLIDDTYSVVYQRCCWSVSVTNIDSPESRGITVKTDITSAGQSECNTRDVVDFPLAFASCPGEPISIPLPFTDQEGDSLAYEICQPLEGGGLLGSSGNPGDPSACQGVAPDPPCGPPYNELPYADGYDNTNPFPTENGITFNPVTNALEFTPTLLGRFVYGLCVSEYRDGEFLGMYRQTIQLGNNIETSTYSIIEGNAWEMAYAPLSKQVSLKRIDDQAKNSVIRLFNSNGIQIKQIEEQSNSISFSVENLSAGLYLIEVEEQGRSQIIKLMVY